MKNLLALLFLLVSAPVWATNYYVSHSGEDGTNGHNGTTETLAWRTLAYCEDQLAAGDKLWIKGDSAYTDADGANGCVVYIDKVGTAAAWITYEGYTTTPGDGGKATINATGLANGIKCYAANTNGYRVFKNLYIYGATSHGFSGGYISYIIFMNIESSLNGDQGISSRLYGQYVQCVANNNASHGFNPSSSVQFVRCKAKNNAGQQYYNIGNTYTIIHSEFVNTISNKTIAFVANQPEFDRCVFVGNASTPSALQYHATNSARQWTVQNCIFVYATNGIQPYPGGDTNSHYMSNNCFYNVTNPYVNCVSSGGDVYADPLFVNAAAGDYCLLPNSPCIGAGTNGSDIGAYGFEGIQLLTLEATE